ncbi:TPA: hypothetical protein ENS27_20185, partial [bacterium]|nr:hypothetical protein [bacterium]
MWIIAVGVAAYSNSFDKVFLFDDYKVIKSYSPLEYVWGFNRRWFVNLTFAFNYLLDGHNEAGYHLFNLVIHIISALLLFFLVRQFIEDSSLFSFLGKWADFLSALVASLWIAHPIQTESVTYVCQ